MTTVAAIDCGTNSIRLLVTDLPDGAGDRSPGEPAGAPVELVRRMEIVRLGEGVDRTGRLAPAALERTRRVLAEYARQATDFGALRVRLVATSATREAENAAEFTAMVRATLGTDPEVISGDEEARLSFAGAAGDLPADLPAPYLVFDIGGGSTEFVVGSPPRDVAGAVSIDIGCVRMTERYLHDDPATERQIAAAREEIASRVAGALSAVPVGTARTVVGLAGSVTTVTAIALGLDRYRPDRIHHARVGADDVAKVSADLLAATRDQRLALPVMHPGRADVIGAGALIMRTVLELAGADEIIASEHDILDGIAWSLA